MRDLRRRSAGRAVLTAHDNVSAWFVRICHVAVFAVLGERLGGKRVALFMRFDRAGDSASSAVCGATMPPMRAVLLYFAVVACPALPAPLSQCATAGSGLRTTAVFLFLLVLQVMLFNHRIWTVGQDEMQESKTCSQSRCTMKSGEAEPGRERERRNARTVVETWDKSGRDDEASGRRDVISDGERVRDRRGYRRQFGTETVVEAAETNRTDRLGVASFAAPLLQLCWEDGQSSFQDCRSGRFCSCLRLFHSER